MWPICLHPVRGLGVGLFKGDSQKLLRLIPVAMATNICKFQHNFCCERRAIVWIDMHGACDVTSRHGPLEHQPGVQSRPASGVIHQARPRCCCSWTVTLVWSVNCLLYATCRYSPSSYRKSAVTSRPSSDRQPLLWTSGWALPPLAARYPAQRSWCLHPCRQQSVAVVTLTSTRFVYSIHFNSASTEPHRAGLTHARFPYL